MSRNYGLNFEIYVGVIATALTTSAFMFTSGWCLNLLVDPIKMTNFWVFLDYKLNGCFLFGIYFVSIFFFFNIVGAIFACISSCDMTLLFCSTATGEEFTTKSTAESIQQFMRKNLHFHPHLANIVIHVNLRVRFGKISWTLILLTGPESLDFLRCLKKNPRWNVVATPKESPVLAIRKRFFHAALLIGLLLCVVV